MSGIPHSPRRRRSVRRFLPAFQPLEERQLLSINLSTINQPQAVEGTDTGSLNLASFSFTTGTVADYTASIAWGDGSSSWGFIVPGAGNTANVVADHAYATAGSDTINVKVAGDGGAVGIDCQYLGGLGSGF
jgi:hypothetical protein